MLLAKGVDNMFKLNGVDCVARTNCLKDANYVTQSALRFVDAFFFRSVKQGLHAPGITKTFFWFSDLFYWRSILLKILDFTVTRIVRAGICHVPAWEKVSGLLIPNPYNRTLI